MTFTKYYKKTTHIVILIFTIIIANLAHPLHAKIASVIGDPVSGEIYFQINQDTKNYPASLTKIMTLYIIFEEIRIGNLNLDDEITISKYANNQQPSKLGLGVGSKITVDKAIDALIVKSANDIAVAVAEKIEGSEKKFIKKMNKYSSIMGLKNTNFANPHGLPNKANLSSALDMFILSSKIINDYPQYLHRFKKTKTKIKNKTYKTHNKLLKKYDHYIGLKTGYIRKSGFQISLLRESNDQYLLGIYFGGNSANERNNKINYLMDKYFNKPESKVIIESSKKTDLKKVYLVQTSSFKKISLSKKHISLLKNKLNFLQEYDHDIMKKGKYFTTYIEFDDVRVANFICDEIKKNKLDCLVKTI